MLAAEGEGPVSEGDGVVSLLFGFYATPPGGWGVLLGLERSHVVVPPGGFAPAFVQATTQHLRSFSSFTLF